jgi:Tfp pilus assembly protein PilX
MDLTRLSSRPLVLTSQHGLAMMTVLLTMVAMTILGLVALTVSGVGTRLAGWGAIGESAAAAAEACIGTAVRLIQDTQHLAYHSACLPGQCCPAWSGPTRRYNGPHRRVDGKPGCRQ